MNRLNRIYYFFKNAFSLKEERGEVSSGYWQDKVREAVYSLLKFKAGRILEIGCGEGLFLKRFLPLSEEVSLLGVDILFEQLAKAQCRTQNKAGLAQADGQRLPFKDSVFDAVACANVLLNINNEQALENILREVSRVLKSGGRAYFDLRNRLNPFIRWKYKFATSYDASINKHHLNLLKLKDFSEKLRRQDCEISRLTSIGFPRGLLAPILIAEAISQKP